MNLPYQLGDHPELTKEVIRARHYNHIHRDVTLAEIESAKVHMDQCVEDIPIHIVNKFGLSDLDLLKYEFKKYVIHCVIEEISNYIYLDGGDGASKTFVSKLLGDHQEVYKKGILDVFSRDIPTPLENGLFISVLYGLFNPGRGKTQIRDRSEFNLVYVLEKMGYLLDESQYDQFYDTIKEVLEEIVYDSNIRLSMAFFYLDQESQREKIAERREDPRTVFRVGEVDNAAIENNPEQVKEYLKMKDLVSNIDGLEYPVIETSDKEKGAMNAIKHILHDKDYAKRSTEIDFTPDPEPELKI